MRAVVAGLVATVSLLALPAPAAAAPPEDVAAYCRAAYPQVSVQVRCLSVEHAAAARVSQASASADPEILDRCLSDTTSWAAMEACLAQSARLADPGGAMTSTPPPTAEPDLSGPGREGGDTLAPPLVATRGSSGAPSPSTSTPGRGPGLPSLAPIEPPSRPIPEADADRHLRAILERTGTSVAQCRKKQYGPGWVTICDDTRPAARARVNASPAIDDRLGL
jgi:hypothetical protein